METLKAQKKIWRPYCVQLYEQQIISMSYKHVLYRKMTKLYWNFCTKLSFFFFPFHGFHFTHVLQFPPFDIYIISLFAGFRPVCLVVCYLTMTPVSHTLQFLHIRLAEWRKVSERRAWNILVPQYLRAYWINSILLTAHHSEIPYIFREILTLNCTREVTCLDSQFMFLVIPFSPSGRTSKQSVHRALQLRPQL